MVSGGIMNTHSREADCRVELLVAAGLRAGVSRDNLMKILDSADNDRGNCLFGRRKKDKACHGLSDGKNHLLYE